MQPIIQIVAGDSAPDITFTCLRTDGSIVNLTSATVKFLIRDLKTGQNTNDTSNSCTISEPVAGQCIYRWTAGGADCPEPGVYRGILQINYASNERESSTLRIEALANNNDQS
jgi:hypothetical protein